MKKLYLLLLLVIAPALSAGAITRRALIFGLGKYEDASWGKIHGDADVYYVHQMLMAGGFTDVKTLKNEQATKQRMVKAFIDLANRCKKGDIVYVHYSGHGQLMTDVDGDESLRTTARHGQWDEAWVPYDAYMNYCSKDKGEKHLSDDEVAFYLGAIRDKIGTKGKLIVAIDACHSGDATRGDNEECVRGVDTKFNIPRNPNADAATTSPNENWMTISACKPYQLSSEVRGLNIGKLTYALHAIGKEVFTLSNEELQRRLDKYMELNRGRLPQNPMVTGKK